MNELKQMNKKVNVVTVILMIIVSMIGGAIAYFMNISVLHVIGGVVIGAIAGLIGFRMINHMTSTIEYAENAQASGFFGYMTRYLMYAVIFVVSILLKMNPFALLAGFTCHKVAIIFYSINAREEED